MNPSISPPAAKKISKQEEYHHDVIIGDYGWLRDNNWPDVKDKEVLEYLNKENAYCDEVMKPRQDITDLLYQELKDRIKEEDYTVPVKIDDYYYYSFIEKGQDYWVHARKKGALDNDKQVTLDENELAQGKDFLNIRAVEESPDHKLLAYSADYDGDERYTIYLKNIDEGENLKDEIDNTFGNVIWHENNQGFFYIPANEQWRAKEIYYHEIGADKSQDKLIYKEDDETYSAWIGKSDSKQFIFLGSSCSNATEAYYISLDDPEMKPQLILKREENHLYSVNHHNDYFYIQTNDAGKNFRVVKTFVTALSKENWQEVIPHSDKVYIERIDLYQDHMVVSTKELGLNKIEIINLNDKTSQFIGFPDPAYSASLQYTTFDAQAIRFSYSSLNTPFSIREYNFKSQNIQILKTQEIPSGFDSSEYAVERVWVTARDKEKVPVSLVYKKSLFKKDGSNPLYLWGYGSYGISIPPSFNRNIISLVNRGFVYAIAHIRGGDDLGFEWYEKAKFLNKRLTFWDFIDSAQHLIEEKYTSKGNIVIAGGSAGGMLMGVSVNEAAELYKCAVAHVPFVDVLNTMLDESLPLTPGEFKEWGNPKDKKYYDYIKSYCPYSNVKVQDYPAMFVTAGISDPRVTYWEPAKWVAKLREIKTDNNLLLLKTNMETGHFGKSGRFEYLKEVALEYNFILKNFSLEF